MAQEYARVHELYMQLQDLQPPTSHYHHQYDLSQANPSAAPAYELTTGDGGGNAEPPPGALMGAHAPQPQGPSMPPSSHVTLTPLDPRKRKGPQFSERYEMPAASATRKRKPSSYGTASACDDDGGDDSRSTSTIPDKKQNHSEIEKRRRDKMNTYISELSSMIPMCGAMARKLDKLTVLRMAVQHLRSVRGTLSACPLTARPRPAVLSERELNALVLQAAQDCFLLVVGCDRGRLLYVSASVKKMLHYEQSELLGQSLFDILHPKDVAKVKEQLSSSDLSPRERLIDIKTMLPVKADVVAGASRFCPGARRSFFCRIKCKMAPEPNTVNGVPVKEEAEPAGKIRKKQVPEKKYSVVQCTGYLKSWAPAEMSDGTNVPEGGEEGDACNMSCLVAVGRALPDLLPTPASSPLTRPLKPLQFVSRHATDGKFVFVDQRVTLALGFLPQELLGTSLYEYVNGSELGGVARTHKQALLRRESLHTPTYSFRRKDNTLARIQTHFKPFRNPWTKDVECLVANNTVVTDERAAQQQDPTQPSFDMYKQTGSSSGSVEGGATLSHGNEECEVKLSIANEEREAKLSIDNEETGAISSIKNEESETFSLQLSPESLPAVAPCDVSGVSEADVEMQRLIDSQVESHKIGSAIAEEVLRSSSSEFSPDLPADLLQDAVLNQQASLADILCADMPGYNQVRNNVPLSAAGASSPPPAQTGDAMTPGTPPPASPPLPHLGLDGNGEAAMAVIMTLLEADAGLGGPVNFSGLPWPLP